MWGLFGKDPTKEFPFELQERLGLVRIFVQLNIQMILIVFGKMGQRPTTKIMQPYFFN